MSLIKKVGPTSCETEAVAEGGAQRILGKMLKESGRWGRIDI